MLNRVFSRFASVVNHTAMLHRVSCKFQWVVSKKGPATSCKHKTSETLTPTTHSADQSQLTTTQSAVNAAARTTALKIPHGEIELSKNRCKLIQFKVVSYYACGVGVALVLLLYRTLQVSLSTKNEFILFIINKVNLLSNMAKVFVSNCKIYPYNLYGP